MTRRRWIADECSGDRAALIGSNAAHLSRVLRAKVGQEFDIACGGKVRLGRIVAITDDRVDFELGAETQSGEGRETILLLAIYKFDRLEWAIEKCTELGASRIIPVVARRTDSHLGAAAQKRVERWRRIAHEAAQQSRRLGAPVIDDPMKLKAALAVEANTKLLLNENEQSVTLRESLGAATAPIALAIGPEGGWADDELQAFETAGWNSVTLGSTILRAETAAIAALAGVTAILD